MYKAAVVEDEQDVMEYIINTLSEGFQKKNLSVSFDGFLSGGRFLREFEKHHHYDMIFLDIEMPEIDGIEVCRKIRAISPGCLVVFISNKEELVFQTFEVQPFRFIRKNEFHKMLPSLIDALEAKLRESGRNILRISEPATGDVYSFDVSQILYIEAQRKDCCINTSSGKTVIRCQFSFLEELLTPYRFIKTHRSYLVNSHHIFYIGRNHLVLTNKEEIPISRGKIDEVKKKFLLYNT